MALLMLRTARAAIVHLVGGTEMEIAHRLRTCPRTTRRSHASRLVPRGPGDA
jgi:hypothetical protein